MRKTITFLTAILFATTIYAQQGFNYKAVITEDGTILEEVAVDVRFSILESDGTTELYIEKQIDVMTDENGIINLYIGEGSASLGDFSTIDWSDIYYLKVEVETPTSAGYIDMGTTALKAVPYAKMATKAAHLLPTDRIVIGDDVEHTEMLYVYAEDNSSTGELVDFRIQSPGAGKDILNMEFGEEPGVGSAAQFIECNINGANKFRVDHTGNIYTNDGLTIKNNINLFSNGEVNTAYSGDADMKAYMYGSVLMGGEKLIEASSSGFDSSAIATGIYRITFTTPFQNFSDYITTATAADTAAPQIVTVHQATSHVDIYIWDLAGDEVDSQFNFVIFKK